MRLCCKAALLVLWFVLGLALAGGFFPVLHGLFTPGRAKGMKDSIKKAWLCGFGSILNLKVEKKGDVSESAGFLVSNHVSWIDIIVLGRFVPGCFVAKSDISGWPVIGFLARQAGTLFIRRGDKKEILKISESMSRHFRQNGTVIAFPEGTTSEGDGVLDFHASLFQPALSTKTAIQPVAIQYLGIAGSEAPFVGEDDFVPHLLKILKLETVDVRVIFLPAVDSVGKSRFAISTEARNQIARTLSQADDPLPRSLRSKSTMSPDEGIQGVR
ncbi:MAG: lysophospholipid acyltransferase family protein [Gammaproteobacteria bacterium]